MTIDRVKKNLKRDLFQTGSWPLRKGELNVLSKFSKVTFRNGFSIETGSLQSA